MRPAGTLERNELWMKCWFCGDSPAPYKAHLSINVTNGLYHCYRCNSGGKLSTAELVSLGVSVPILLDHPEDESPVFEQVKRRIVTGPAQPRASALSRFHIDQYDAFESRMLRGQLVGYHLRGRKGSRQMVTVGQRAFGFSGAHFLRKDFARLVEGPYDVLDPETDLCTFGFPGQEHFRMLKGYSLILCPDGDVWTDPGKFKSYFGQVRKFSSLLAIIGVERVPDGLDPDETTLRETLSWSQVLNGFNHLSDNRRRPSRQRKDLLYQPAGSRWT